MSKENYSELLTLCQECRGAFFGKTSLCFHDRCAERVFFLFFRGLLQLSQNQGPFSLYLRKPVSAPASK